MCIYQSRHKDEFIQRVWLPIACEIAKLLRPKVRTSNRKLRMFTVTDPECAEVKLFASENLVKPSSVIPWNYSRRNITRLEAELPFSMVLGRKKLEDHITTPPNELDVHSPIELVNLDFCSQDIVSDDGRIEKELNTVFRFLNANRIQPDRGWALDYTTLVNGNSIDPTNLNVRLENHNININALDGKKDYIESLIEWLPTQAGLQVKLMKKHHMEIVNPRRFIITLGLILKRT